MIGYQTGVRGAFQTTPLVVDGIMYLTGGEGNAAVDVPDASCGSTSIRSNDASSVAAP
ncbi:MAG: hypothetical protein WKF37_11675 [Bryobacteraceae bacterium]